jgi:DNA-binding response OmpR family regulator
VREKPLRHLLHADFDSLASLTRSEILRVAGFAVQTVHSAVDCLKEFARPSFDAVLVHASIRYQSGTDIVPLLKKLRPNIPVIILHASEATEPGADAAFCIFKSPGDLIVLMEEQIGNARSYGKTAS